MQKSVLKPSKNIDEPIKYEKTLVWQSLFPSTSRVASVGSSALVQENKG